MVKKKTKSKRQTIRLRNAIEKKVKSHNHKMKKLAKKQGKLNPGHEKNRAKKDPGIPNLFPLKAQMLQKIIKDKEVAREQKLKKPTLQHLNDEGVGENVDRTTDYEEAMQNSFFEDKEMLSNKHQSAGAYFRELKKVLQECDVVLEVLDARDPMGCRCRQIEQRIVEQSGKRLILVLNKIDLVPAEIAEGWIAYLRREFPTIAFKASTQSQRANTAIFGGRMKIAGLSKELSTTSQCIGANELIQLLKNYCRNRDIKTSITVGIVGYPNVGKSSIINSLKRSRAVGVASTAGYTKTVQEVHLDKNIKLLDSPGVIFYDDPNSTESSLALRNSLQLEKLQDPIGVVHKMVSKVPARQLLQVFDLQSFRNADEFILQVCAQKGKLKKGGVPDLEATAISILRDWNEGKIPFFTTPPALPKSEHMSQARIVMAHEFSETGLDIDALSKGDKIISTLRDDTPEVQLPAVKDQTYSLAVGDGDVEMN